MKKLNLKDKLKLIKATILSGTIALSVSGCGLTEEQQQKNPQSNGHQIVQEIDTIEPTTEEQIEVKLRKKTIEGTIKRIGKIALNQQIETQPTEIQQDPEQPIEQDPEQPIEQDPEQKETQQHTQQPTQQEPEQKETQQEPEQKETQQPTQKPTEKPTEKTTQQYIDYDSIDYNKNDITSSDPYYAEYAFYEIVGEFNKDLFGNYSHQTQYGVSKSVVGTEILTVLNYNQNMNKDMLRDQIYDCVSEEEFTKYCDNLNLADYQCFYETNVDFRKYVIDEDFANFLNTISAEYKKYKNGENSNIKEYIDEYFKQNDTNYVRKYFMANTRAMLDRTSGDYFETLDPEVRQEYYDNVVKPLYNEIMNTQTKTR